MLVFRWLFLGLLGWIAYRFWSQHQRAKQNGDKTVDGATKVEPMVKCAQCELYVPKQQAITDGDHHFCSEQHKNEFVKL